MDWNHLGRIRLLDVPVLFPHLWGHKDGGLSMTLGAIKIERIKVTRTSS